MKEYPIFLLPIAFRVELMCSIIDKFVEEIKQCPLPPPWGYFGMGAKFEYFMTSKSYIGMFSTARYHLKTRLGLRFKNLKNISFSISLHCNSESCNAPENIKTDLLKCVSLLNDFLIRERQGSVLSHNIWWVYLIFFTSITYIWLETKSRA